MDMPIQNMLIAVAPMNMPQAEIYEYALAWSNRFCRIVMFISAAVKNNVLTYCLVWLLYGP